MRKVHPFSSVTTPVLDHVATERKKENYCSFCDVGCSCRRNGTDDNPAMFITREGQKNPTPVVSTLVERIGGADGTGGPLTEGRFSRSGT